MTDFTNTLLKNIAKNTQNLNLYFNLNSWDTCAISHFISKYPNAVPGLKIEANIIPGKKFPQVKINDHWEIATYEQVAARMGLPLTDFKKLFSILGYRDSDKLRDYVSQKEVASKIKEFCKNNQTD